jgi:hypothetical protein
VDTDPLPQPSTSTETAVIAHVRAVSIESVCAIRAAPTCSGPLPRIHTMGNQAATKLAKATPAWLGG